jgi:hypothetical protein
MAGHAHRNSRLARTPPTPAGPARPATAKPSGFQIDIDLEPAERAAKRVRLGLHALRRRHDLTPYEYTNRIRVVPAGETHSHPILTLGTRFTETEDQLLAVYLHEQMHWYLYHLGGIDTDPIEPFFDDLVRRYPHAPTHLPEGARTYDQTYAHLVINWLELHVVAEFIGRERAFALAETIYGYRWIYRTVIRDWDALGRLFSANGILPIVPAPLLLSRRQPTSGGLKKTSVTGRPLLSQPSRRKPRARGGSSAG